MPSCPHQFDEIELDLPGLSHQFRSTRSDRFEGLGKSEIGQDCYDKNCMEVAWGRAVQMSSRDFRQIYFYEFKLGGTAAQTARNIIEVWGQGSVNECTVQRWFQKFRAGNTSIEDEPHGSRPPTLG
uniref:HTH_48 domain-containing protein n=1 Tax=Haemonchus contortus TaxID=6289 RepID=A0A7I4XXI0_HAECO